MRRWVIFHGENYCPAADLIQCMLERQKEITIIDTVPLDKR